MGRLRRIILSKYFLPIVFIFFGLLAVFYAGYIGFGIPSDENYHFGSIKYYADQPITTGPFTHNQDPASIPIIRAIDRNPNYLYHYLLSLPLRGIEKLHLSQYTEVLLLRFINIILVMLALYVLKRCLDEISDDKLVKNLAIFALSVTGMAVWVAGSINYDNLANLLFVLFVWVSIRIIKKPSALLIILALILAMATTLSKSVFIPVLGIGLIALVFALRTKSYGFNIFYAQTKKSFRTRRLLTSSVILTALLFSGLIVERIGLNLVHYQAVKPSCTKFFKVEECRTYNVFNRNFSQKRSYNAEAKASFIKNTNPISFSGEWLYTMYNTLYFHLGDRRFESRAINQIIAFLFAIVLSVTVILSRAKSRLNKSAKYVLLLTVSYVTALFLYNANTYISFGRKYAFQGRYLLPVLGFLYFFVILLVVNTYRNRKPSQQKVFAAIWLAAVIIFIVAHFPPLLLAKETDSSWRQEFILPKEIVD